MEILKSNEMENIMDIPQNITNNSDAVSSQFLNKTNDHVLLL